MRGVLRKQLCREGLRPRWKRRVLGKSHKKGECLPVSLTEKRGNPRMQWDEVGWPLRQHAPARYGQTGSALPGLLVLSLSKTMCRRDSANKPAGVTMFAGRDLIVSWLELSGIHLALRSGRVVGQGPGGWTSCRILR